MVMAQSLFRRLKARRPGSAIDVVAPIWTRPLLERMPEVRLALDMPLNHGQLGLRTRRRLGRSLRRTGYRQAIVLPNSWKSALVPFWARIPRRTGYLGEMRWWLLNDVRRLDPTRLPMTVQRFLALGEESGGELPDPIPVPRLQVQPDKVEKARQRLGLTRTDAPVLGLCPGAEYGPAKKWPAAYFAEIARHKRAEGWQTWLFGSERDIVVGREVASAAGDGCTDLTGRTSLAEAVDLLSATSLVVTNDSGLMHVAAAVGRPLVAVYGSSDPGFTPPLHDGSHVVRLGIECSPCFKRECPLGHYKCLRDLKPAQVLGAAKELLGC